MRTSSLVRRAYAHRRIARAIHEDARAEFLGMSVTNAPGADPRYGMDMTRAPGYEVAADEELPLMGKQKLADFAARHGRLTTAQVSQADGHLWVGSVLYPTSFNVDFEISSTWENASEEDFDSRLDDDNKSEPVVEAKRRYTGGQARRIRKEREKTALKKAVKRPAKRDTRKPKNDVPHEQDE